MRLAIAALVLGTAACKDEAAAPPAPARPIARHLSAEREIVGGKRAIATSIAITSKLDAVIVVRVDGVATIDDKTFGGDGDSVTLLLSVATGGNHAVHWVKPLAIDSAQVAIDSKDAIVVVGELAGSVDLGGGKLTSAGGTDVVVAKLAADGTHVWSHRFGGAGTDAPVAIAIDREDDIVIAGSYAGAVDFGGGKHLAAKADADLFVARFSPTGEAVYANRVSGGGFGTSALFALAIDDGDNAVAAGSIIANGDSAPSAFFVGFTPSGSPAWSTVARLGLPAHVVADGRGGMLVAGTDFAMPAGGKPMEIDTLTLSPVNGKMTAFVANLGADHEVAWQLSLGPTEIGGQNALARGAGGNAVILSSTWQMPGTESYLHPNNVLHVSPAGKLVGDPTELLNTMPSVYNAIATRGPLVAIAQPTGRGVNLFVQTD